MSDSGDKPTISAPKGSWGSLLAAPRLISAPAQSSTTNSVLRPPQLQTGRNPFGKVTSPDAVSVEDTSQNKSEVAQPEKKIESVPLFLPLRTPTENISFTAVNSVPCAPPEPISTNCDFVFGQNLHNRIQKNEGDNNSNNDNHTNLPATNGTSDLLFSAAVKANNDGQTSLRKDESSSSSHNSSSWSWVTESPAPAIPPSGPIFTGEEDEDNIIQMNCRLFAFEDGQWKERGRGHLRLNDYEHGSRLVCRSAGSLRVLLNTKIWGEMTVDLAGTKSLRVTATDAQNQVKIFLIMARPDEITRLSRLLNLRVDKAKLRDNSKGDGIPESPSLATGKPGNDSSTTEDEPSRNLTKINNAPLVNNDSVIEKESKLKENHIDRNSTKETNKEGNPIVIISNEEEGAALPIKRSLDVNHEEDVQSKKVCIEQTDGDVSS